MRLSNPPPDDSWRVRWRKWRNQLMASPSFQRWASRTPGVRKIARRRAAELFDLIAGFSYSQIVLAAIETGMLDELANGSVSSGELATAIDLPADASMRLFKAAAAIGLVERIAPEAWMLTARGSVLQANVGARAMVSHHRLLYDDLRDPVVILRNDRTKPTALSDFWRYGARDAAGDYSQLMAVSQHMVSAQVIAAYPFERHRAVLDVGGGHGTFLAALAAAHPALRLGLFDLASVVDGASHYSGIEQYQGDFFTDPIPTGFDCMTLVRILHDHDDEQALRLVRNIRKSLLPGGRLVIAEPMAGTRGAESMGDGYFGFYLWAMGTGRPRRASEIGEMLKRAGFRRSQQYITDQPIVTSMIVAVA